MFRHPPFKYTYCTEAYIGESGQGTGRHKEHLKAPSPIHHNSSSTGHPLSPQCFNIIHQETQGPFRNIKEAMFICVNDPSLNRNFREVTAATHLGQHLAGHTSITSQAI